MENQGKLIEMLQEMGYCPGVENYSMHLSGKRLHIRRIII